MEERTIMDTDEDIHMTAATSGDHTDLEGDPSELRHSIDDSHDRVIEDRRRT